VLVTATSASTRAIRSAAAASTRCSPAGRRSGAGAGDQVTVTDSHHPGLRMAPAASRAASALCQLHVPLAASLAVTGQGLTRGVWHMHIVARHTFEARALPSPPDARSHARGRRVQGIPCGRVARNRLRRPWTCRPIAGD
jgi:hypothetical protein